jgi:tetratricopeptide (TPR) repeat protein
LFLKMLLFRSALKKDPVGVEQQARLEKELEREDLLISDVQSLLEKASSARDIDQLDRAEKLTRRVLKLSPSHLGALAILCSTLRAIGNPQQALKETNYYRRSNYAPLITSRAAAYCDLKQWESAKKEIGYALAIQTSEEAFNVVKRIKAVRPDLYKSTK